MTTTNLKTKHNQNCQEIELWKSNDPGVKEDTFIQTGRRDGDRKPGVEDAQQGSGWQTRWSHIYMQINQEQQLGNKTDCATKCSRTGKRKFQNLWLYKAVGVVVVRETASFTGESIGGTHGVLECTQTQGISTRRMQFAYGWQRK